MANQFPTSAENIALDLIFQSIGEVRFNRTEEQYRAIRERLPRIKVLHGQVNMRLQKIAEEGSARYHICHFKAGDGYICIEEYPTSVSIETVRSALVKIGMRKPRPREA